MDKNYKTLFFKNPSINPYTERTIKYEGNTYKELVQKFGDPYKKNDPILPDDMLRHSLLYSDIETIINVCTSNKFNLCDDQFWKLKFEHDKLPLLKKGKTFNEWTKEYILVKNAKQEAINMINIIYGYNIYKGRIEFYVSYYDTSSIILIPHSQLVDIDNALKMKGIIKKDGIRLTFKYDKIKTEWVYDVAGSGNYILRDQHVIYDEMIYIVLKAIIDYKNGGKISITDLGRDPVLYDQLINHPNITGNMRAYLMGYDLIKNCYI